MKKKLDLTCFCSVCDKSFQYGDDVSPMYTDEVWSFLVNHYNLVEHEKSAIVNLATLRTAKLSDRDAHTFICKDCAEKALDRPITISDISRCHFNRDFVISYFNQTAEEADRFLNGDQTEHH